jgi:UDP-glucose 4-epimerase
MKILVTGGAGFVGSHIVDRLVTEGYKVRVIDNLSSGRFENLKQWLSEKCIELIPADLRDLDAAFRVVEDIEVVFHFAANPEVRVSVTDPETHFTNNVVATFNLLEAMRRRDVKEIIFASSSSIYGESGGYPVGEEAAVRPVSVYGASKAACESIIHAYAMLYNIRAVILRYANIVGPRLRHGVVWDFINKLLANPRRLEILGDGNQLRSYVYITDAVEATMMVWEKTHENYRVYNVASVDWITVDEVADTVIETLKLKNVEKVYKPVLHGIGWLGDVKRIVLKIDNIRELGFEPKMKSKQAVAKTVIELLNEIGKNQNK